MIDIQRPEPLVITPWSIHPDGMMPDRLDRESWDALLDWLRSVGVDPNSVPLEKPLEYDGFWTTLQFWWRSTPDATTPQDAQRIEAYWESGEVPLSLLMIQVKENPMPDALSQRLFEIAAKRASDAAAIRAAVADLI